MDLRSEKLNLFFERIKNTGFWQIIFGGWRQIRNLSYDAYEEFKRLVDSLEDVGKDRDKFKNSIEVLNRDNEHLGRKAGDQEKDIIALKEKMNSLEKETSQLRQDNAVYKRTENDRKNEYESEIKNIISVKEQIRKDRETEQEEVHKKEVEQRESMKETWLKHQDAVRDFIKNISLRCRIEYVDEVPFKGNPDNTIKICGEYVIFDAKSPASEDMGNFPLYIKAQTESVKKYIKEENVRKDIFLVIPSNTVDVIEKFSYNMADYQVYIVTLDVLEPLMLLLKKIESYEFMNQLTPEERENICRIIGKFAHMTKRRIQIDHFFAREFLNILTKCEADLPGDILQEVINFERAEMLNPPQARRTKQIPTTELESDTKKIQKEAGAKGIVFPSSVQKDLKNLPLYEGEDTINSESFDVTPQ